MVNRYLSAALGALALLLLWQLAIDFNAINFSSLPAPSAIGVALIGLVASADVYVEIGHTLLATLLGWMIATSIGLVIGSVLGLSKVARDYSLPTIEFLRPLPGIAFAPLALLLFGFSLSTELLVIVIPTVWPVLINTMSGFAAVPARLHDVSRSFRIPYLASIWTIYIPAAAPAVLVGAQFGLTLSLIMAVAIEMIGNPAGLGYAVIREQQALNPPLMFAYIIIIALIGVVLSSLLTNLARVGFPGHLLKPNEGQ